MEGIKQLYLDCPSETDKYDALIRLYGLMTIGSSIIFVRVSPQSREYITISTSSVSLILRYAQLTILVDPPNCTGDREKNEC